MHCSTSESVHSGHSINLFARAQAGDQDAWTALFHECFPKVRRVVGRRLNSRLRRFVDSTDIANVAMGNFALKAREFRFESIDEVRDFLIFSAYQLINDEHRRRHTRKRDSDREQPMTGVHGHDGLMLSSNDPTPSQVAVANEMQEQLLSDTSLDDDERLIVARRAEHYDIKEIATETNLSVQKIQRFLRRLKKNFLN